MLLLLFPVAAVADDYAVAGQALQGRRLEELSVGELSQILADVETLVRDLSEELVQDLGVRDELEFEKVTL